MPIVLKGGGAVPAGPGGTAFSVIIQACAKEMADGQWPVVRNATGGSATTLVDSRLIDSRTDADAMWPVGKWLRVTVDSTEYIRKITSFDATTGALTISGGDFASNPTTEEYEIHYVSHPGDLKDGINDALADMSYQELLPLTLGTDLDMETSGTANWTATTATLAKNTTYVLFGRQSLSVAATAANGYAQSAAIPVTPDELLIVAAAVYGDEQQAELILYDVTNGADIETARHDEEGWALLSFNENVPEDCYEVAVRCRTKTNAGTTYWDHVSVLKASELIYDRPSWLAKSQDFIKLISFPASHSLTSDNADNAYRLWIQPSQHVDMIQQIEAHRGVVPLRLELDSRPARAIFVMGKRNYPSLSADTDETEADKKTVIAGALYHAYRKLGADYADLAGEWGYRFMRLRRGVEGRQTVRMVSPYA